MRSSCLLCAEKHLQKAQVISAEVALHYHDHMRYVCGEMACAEDHLVKTHPELARQIREHRLAYRASFYPDADLYDVPFDDLLDVIEELITASLTDDPGDGITMTIGGPDDEVP